VRPRRLGRAKIARRRTPRSFQTGSKCQSLRTELCIDCGLPTGNDFAPLEPRRVGAHGLHQLGGAGCRPRQGCIKLLDSLSAIAWRSGPGRGGAFLLVSPLLGPLPARSSRGEDEALDAALTPLRAWVLRLIGGVVRTHKIMGRSFFYSFAKPWAGGA